MSITDEIVGEIVIWCKKHGHEEFSREVIQEDYIAGYVKEIEDEIVERLKAKGIVVK